MAKNPYPDLITKIAALTEQIIFIALETRMVTLVLFGSAPKTHQICTPSVTYWLVVKAPIGYFYEKLYEQSAG